MKKLFLTALAAAAAVGVNAQNASENAQQAYNMPNVSYGRIEDAFAGENSMTVTFAPIGFFGNEARSFGAIGLEYDRALPRNWSVGAVGLYAPICHPGTRAGEWPRDGAFVFAGARVSYTLPVVRDRLYFRLGAGMGIGVQHRHESAHKGDVPAPDNDTHIMPHLLVDGNWILRVSQRVDLRFSPLIACPSQYIFGLGSSLHRASDTRFEYANLLPIGLTMRF